MSDGSVVHTCGSKVGGILEPVTPENYKEFGMLRLMDSPKMKGLLNTVSMPNWYHCSDEALRKSGKTREDIDYLAILHIKKSGHMAMLQDLGLTPEKSIYLADYGHIGQIDQILSLELALKEGKVKDGSTVCMIAAGIGYTWAANIIQWGEQ
jgi:3-oxoacyl-[acyl-carrier-protein] synthase-3